MKSQLVSVFLVLVVSMVTGCVSIAPHGYSKLENQDNENLWVNYDNFNNLTTVRHKYHFRMLANDPIELLVVSNESSNRLYAEFKYSGSNWIFFDKAILIDGDNNNVRFSVRRSNKINSVEYGGRVHERASVMLTGNSIETLSKILSSSDNIQVRLSGKYTKDYQLHPNHIQALREVLDHFKS